MLAARNEGTSTIDVGACAGTELGLESPRIFRNVTTGGSGRISLNVNLPDRWCGRYLQGIDRDCSTSAVFQCPE